MFRLFTEYRKSSCLLILLTCIFCMCSRLSAQVVSNGFGATDLRTGLRWLPIAPYSYDQLFNNPSQSGMGGFVPPYRIATDAEVQQLLQDMGAPLVPIPTPTSTYNGTYSSFYGFLIHDNGTFASKFINLFGMFATFHPAPENPLTTGFTSLTANWQLGQEGGYIRELQTTEPVNTFITTTPSTASNSFFDFLIKLNVAITEVDTPNVTNGLHTFISSDTITLKAQTAPNTDVKWTVIGLNAANNISGFPKAEAHTADSSGISTITFSPDQNSSFVTNRNKVWENGSYNPNPPVSFDVNATVVIGGQSSTTYLSQSNLGQISQDQTDIIRQEYVDYVFQTVPARTDFVPTLSIGNITGFNKGNYSLQLDGGMIAKYNTVLAAYRGATIIVQGKPFTIPASAIIAISSGYRNPQRNVAVGSLFPQTSNHTKGHALDLVPSPFPAIVAGKKMMIDAKYLNQPLFNAAMTAGTAFVEEGNNPDVTIDEADHIHVQW